MNFSIRTATDPDGPLTNTEVDQHKVATETFQRRLWALCKDNEVFDNDHERASELYQRAAFDTALELGVELVVEDIPGGVQFTFNFVPTIIITEVDPEEDLPGLDILDDLQEADDALKAAVVERQDRDIYDPEAEALLHRPRNCECGAGRRLDGSFTCADPTEIEDEASPRLDAVNQGGGLWGVTLDGVVVVKDESYTVVHGIIEDADVDELREIRDSLLDSTDETPASEVVAPLSRIADRYRSVIIPQGTSIVAADFAAARVGRSIAYLLQLTANDNPDSVRFDTVQGDKSYIGLARTIARIFDDSEFRRELVLDSIILLPCDPEDDDLEDEREEIEPEFTDGLEDYRGGVFAK